MFCGNLRLAVLDAFDGFYGGRCTNAAVEGGSLAWLQAHQQVLNEGREGTPSSLMAFDLRAKAHCCRAECLLALPTLSAPGFIGLLPTVGAGSRHCRNCNNSRIWWSSVSAGHSMTAHSDTSVILPLSLSKLMAGWMLLSNFSVRRRAPALSNVRYPMSHWPG